MTHLGIGKRSDPEYMRRYAEAVGGRTEASKLKNRVYQREALQRLRAETLHVLGDTCVRCGFDDWRALQIDHVDGGGHQERLRTKTTATHLRNVIASVKADEGRYQLLCANCNWIKRHENREFGNLA